MKVLSALLILFCIPVMLYCDILEVDLGGNYDYQVVQEAINASATGDTVLVHQGRYYENLNLNGHNITLASLYILEPLQVYIDSTIIDGNYLGSCIIIENHEDVEINGFTLMNNEDGINIPLEEYPLNAGGGIYINQECNVTVANCIIRNCFSLWGGGLAVCEGADCTLRNVDIYKNRALICGGGVYTADVMLNFDPNSRCSIYDNIAPLGMDMYYFENAEPLEILLDMGSIVLTEPDYFYIINHDSPQININCESGYFSLIDQDIYVAPWGDDSLSGLNVYEPLKTIAYAMQIIEPDSLNPKTIHLAEGIYSYSQNDQIFPFSVKSDIRLEGENMENTILDNEFYSSILVIYDQKNIKVSDLKIINCQSEWLSGAVSTHYSEYIIYKNLIIEGCYCSGHSGISAGYSDNLLIENVIIRNVMSYDDDALGLYLYYSYNCTINNVIIDDLNIIGNVGTRIGMDLGFSDVIVRNSIISNCSAYDATLISYQVIEEQFSENKLDLSNLLIINNEIDLTYWSFGVLYLQHRFQPIHITNCTIANNSVAGNLLSVFGMAELTNNLMYNPDANIPLYLNNEINGIAYDVVMQNNLLSDFYVVDLPEHVTLSDNIWNEDPHFYGATYPGMTMDMPDYYQLRVDSPCIDAGTPDTLGLNIPPMDLAGNQRVWNDIIDMGCYEFGAPPHVGNTECEIENVKCKIGHYPNPVYLANNRGNVFLEFTLPDIPQADPVINIYNARGQKVRTLNVTQSLSGLARIAGLATNETQRGEAYSKVWDCRNDRGKTVSSGVYFYVLSVNDQVLGANKFLILK